MNYETDLKMDIGKLIRLIMALSFLFFISNCTNTSNKIINRDIIQKWLNKVLIIPENLEIHEANQDIDSLETKFYSAGIKIVTYLNGDCSACILDLNKWKEYIFNGDLDKDIVFLFFVYSTDYSVFEMMNRTEIHFPYPLIYDNLNQFYKANNIPSNRLLQTFLLDSNNKIILIGNPIYSEKLKELYTIEIKRLKKYQL